MNIYILISIFSATFCFFMFFYFKWYIKKRTSDLELLTEYRSEVYKLIADIDAATDRDSRLVEDRIKKIKEIIEDADKRISVYTREIDRSKTGEALYTNLGRGIRAAMNTKIEPVPEKIKAAYNSDPQPSDFNLEVQKRQVSAPPPNMLTQQAEKQNQASAKNQLRAKIEELADEGFSSAQIASRLKISLSEVDLAMNLISRL